MPKVRWVVSYGFSSKYRTILWQESEMKELQRAQG